MKKQESLIVIASSITLRFANAGLTDNIDLIRCNIFGMDVANLIEKFHNSVTIDDVKQTTGFRGLPIVVPDDAVLDILNNAKSIYNDAE